MPETNHGGVVCGSDIDPETGIRFGMINANLVGKWYEKCDADYGEATCPKCEGKVEDIDEAPEDPWLSNDGWEVCGSDYCCFECKYTFEVDVAFPDVADFYFYDDGELRACHPHDDQSISMSKSPYWTWVRTVEDRADWHRVKTYCFGHEWFEGGIAPYLMYSVEDGSIVQPGE